MDIKLLIRTILYYVIVILGLMISIGTSVASNTTNGYCVLYGWYDYSRGLMWPGSHNNCNFAIYFHVIFSVIVGAALAAFFTFVLIKNERSAHVKLLDEFVVQLVMTIVHGVITFITLVSAFVLAVGLGEFCKTLPHFCNLYPFYKDLALATGAAWICVVCWGVQTVLWILVLLSKEPMVPTTT